ncbi:MAG: alpha/beta fold hydrolase [Methylobacterium sp.]|nr:alpha/beta fold hydrolase [Methylobacterium sp.]
MPFVETPSAILFVTEAGPPDRPAILFSNSLGTTQRMWDAVVEELAPDFRCIRYDTRGHGASRRKGRAAFEIADLAEDAIAILDHLALERVHFAGLSLGGMTGQALAALYPHRLASLTLMATTAHMPPAQAWLDRAALVRREGTGAILAATLERWFTPGYLEANPSVIGVISRDFVTNDAEGYAACCEAIARMDLRALLPDISVQTLVVAGQQDPATPVSMSEFLRNQLRHARLAVLNPAAHLLAVEQAASVARLIADQIARSVKR